MRFFWSRDRYVGHFCFRFWFRHLPNIRALLAHCLHLLACCSSSSSSSSSSRVHADVMVQMTWYRCRDAGMSRQLAFLFGGLLCHTPTNSVNPPSTCFWCFFSCNGSLLKCIIHHTSIMAQGMRRLLVEATDQRVGRWGEVSNAARKVSPADYQRLLPPDQPLAPEGPPRLPPRKPPLPLPPPKRPPPPPRPP